MQLPLPRRIAVLFAVLFAVAGVVGFANDGPPVSPPEGGGRLHEVSTPGGDPMLGL